MRAIAVPRSGSESGVTCPFQAGRYRSAAGRSSLMATVRWLLVETPSGHVMARREAEGWFQRSSWISERECVDQSMRILSCEEVFDLLDEDVAAHVGDGFGEGELFGACLDAVLCEAALLDAAVSG